MQQTTENNFAALLQDMMQVFMKHQNFGTAISENKSDKNILLRKVGEGFAEYLESEAQKVEQKKLKVSSFNKSIKHRIKFFVTAFGADNLLCNITEAEAERVIDLKSNKPYEREQLRKLGNKVFDYFVKRFYTLSNPFYNIKKSKIQSGEIVIIADDHLLKIVKYIKANYDDNGELFNDLIILLRKTALRPGELFSIVKRNILIDFEKQVASLQITATKNYRTNIVPAVGEAFDIILKYYKRAKGFDDYLFPGRVLRTKKNHIAVDTVSKAFSKACQSLKLPSNYCLYALRATMASELYSKGLPLQEISRLLNHSNSIVTEKYYSRFTSVNNDKLISFLKETKLNNNVKQLKRVV